MTKFVSDTNDLCLDDDVKLFFVASNAIFDEASIASWDAKYGDHYVRPITGLIRALGDTLKAAVVHKYRRIPHRPQRRRPRFPCRSRGTWRIIGASFADAAIPQLHFRA